MIIIIIKDQFVKNLHKCGLDVNEIGISTVAFEYSPWTRETGLGDPAGNCGSIFKKYKIWNLLNILKQIF